MPFTLRLDMCHTLPAMLQMGGMIRTKVRRLTTPMSITAEDTTHLDNASRGLPAWVEQLHLLVTMGETDHEKREQELRLWRSHSVEMAADPRAGSVRFFIAEVESALMHIGWRIKVGTPTLLMPVFLLVLLGVVTLLGAVTDAFTVTQQVLTAVMIVVIAIATIAEVRSMAPVRPRALRIGWLLAALFTFAKAAHLYADPKVPAEQYLAAGAALIAVGLMTNAIRSSTQVRLPLTIVTVGTAVLAASSWLMSTQFTDAAATTYSIFLALLETAIAFLLIRWGFTLPRHASASGHTLSTATD